MFLMKYVMRVQENKDLKDRSGKIVSLEYRCKLCSRDILL